MPHTYIYRTPNNQSVSIDFHFPVLIQFKILYAFLCDILHFRTAFLLIELCNYITILSLFPRQMNRHDSFFRFFISDIKSYAIYTELSHPHFLGIRNLMTNSALDKFFTKTSLSQRLAWIIKWTPVLISSCQRPIVIKPPHVHCHHFLSPFFHSYYTPDKYFKFNLYSVVHVSFSR